MADDLDLNIGDESAADAAQSRIDRRRARRGSSTSSSSESKPKSSGPSDHEITSRLERVFDRIVKWLESRDDDELATVVQEDSQQMVQGIMSITNSVKWLRMPIVWFLNCIEPILAFQRVVRILLNRLAARRMRNVDEPEQESGNYTPEAAAYAGT